MTIVGFPRRPGKIGGPSSFQSRLELELIKKGYDIVYPDDDITPDVIMVFAGTKELLWLKRNKEKGIKILQRLDGINWRYKFLKYSDIKRYFSILNNFNVRFIRNKYADTVVYQSDFIKKWWYKDYGKSRAKEVIIYNGVDINTFKPIKKLDIDKYNLFSLEGTIQYDKITLNIIKTIDEIVSNNQIINKYYLYGFIDNKLKNHLKNLKNIKIMNSVKRENIPKEISYKHIMINLEINPPCPNSVIESLSAGKPVIGYDTGSLKELVKKSGSIIPYYGNPWKLDEPDYKELEKAINDVLGNYLTYSKQARNNAINNFNIEIIVDKYIKEIIKN